MRRLLAVLALGAAVVACSEQATSPQPETEFAPTFDISNGPAETGIVMRGGWPLGFIWGIDDAGLIVFMGADAREACDAWEQYGDWDPENPESDPWQNHVTFSPMTWADKVLLDRLVGVGQASDVPTQVWPYAGGHFAGFCPLIDGLEPLATGVTHAMVTSNDEMGTRSRGSVTNWNFHGLLTRPDNSQAVFAFQLQFRTTGLTKVSVSLK